MRFDPRRRLVFGLYIGLVPVTAFGIETVYMFFRIPPLIWGIPLFAACIFGFVFFFIRHGDRIIVATEAPKHASPASKDA